MQKPDTVDSRNAVVRCKYTCVYVWRHKELFAIAMYICLCASVSVRCARERAASPRNISVGPKSVWFAWASDLVRGREKLEKGLSKPFRGHHVAESARCRPWFLALRAIHIHLVTEATGEWTDGIYIRQW